MAGLKRYCHYPGSGRQDTALLALVENVQREDLSYIEEAVA
jgi:ParB-like chromosome segregation protein Spo0J